MSDEEKVNAQTTEAQETSTPARKKKHWPIVISVLAVIVIAVFVAFLHWHEQPTFCSTMCHATMQPYVDGYYSEDDSLMVTAHAEADVTCLGCHWSQAKMMDLVHEVVMFVTDSFTDPLPDQSQFVSDEFCGACHDGTTAPTKESATAGSVFDPHNIPEGVSFHEGVDMSCGSCHSVHKQSTMVCAQCHDVDVPAGWAAPENARAAASAAYAPFDVHNIPSEVAMHQTAGADGGEITCNDCHETKTLVCATCHASFFPEESLPEGWSLPETAMDIPMGGATEEASTDEAAATDAAAIDMASVADGEYTANGTGIGGDVPVTVTVAGGKITAVTVGDNGETAGIGSNAIEQLPALIVEANGTDGVDAVAGASITSKAIFSAVNEALTQGVA